LAQKKPYNQHKNLDNHETINICIKLNQLKLKPGLWAFYAIRSSQVFLNGPDLFYSSPNSHAETVEVVN